uniref:BEN domain-containing protein n=1 Tax=Macrostomum lignano TaxID=282301 RepID=A0A1I8H5H9_9PLAT
MDSSAAAANRRKAQAPKRLMPQSWAGQQQPQQRRQIRSGSISEEEGSIRMSLKDYFAGVQAIAQQATAAATAAAAAPLDLTKTSTISANGGSDGGGSSGNLPASLPPLGPTVFLPFPLGGAPHQSPRPQSSSSPSSSTSGIGGAANGSQAPRTLEKCAEATLEETAAWRRRRMLRGLQQPSLSEKFVILSDAHPAVSMTLADYQESISRASGSATRHLRILMKHFFSQGTLAKSSLTGNGQYKEVLDENLTMGIRDYIQHRYPKLKSAKINLCCTDVCVQARRVIEKQARGTSGGGVVVGVTSLGRPRSNDAAAVAASAKVQRSMSPSTESAAGAAAVANYRDSSSMDYGEDQAEDGSEASSHDLTPDLNPSSLNLHRLHPIDSPID